MTSVASRQDHDDSGEYSDASQDIEHNNLGNDGGQHESDYDSRDSDSNHSDADPDKQETERRVDDDEDRSNPQYIPKRGTFYEHDDRTAASGEETSNTASETVSEKREGPETPAERRRPPRKSETLNKWSHDKYNENEQVPKSRDELVSIYGYDIRNEDAPPHARRNRRYGRGPNKYTRTWEDEEAYKRQAGVQPPKKPPSPADFPELGATNKTGRRTRAPRPRSKSQPTSNESSENGSALRRNASIKATKSNKMKPMNKAVKPMREMMSQLENLTITSTVNNSQGQSQRKVNTVVAQQRQVPAEQVKKKPTIAQTIAQSNAAQTKPQQTSQHKQPSSQKPQQQLPQQQHQQHQPANAEARGGSKRYSSLRQRPLAETYSPQQQSQQPQQQPKQHRYHGEFVGGAPPGQHQGSPGPLHPQQMIHQQVHRNAPNQLPHGPSPPHQAMSHQALPHQTLPQQALSQQALPQQALPQQALPQQPLPQQPLPQQSLPQQPLPQQPLPQQPLPQQALSQQPHNQQQVRLGLLEQQQQIVPHPINSHHTMHNLPQPHNIGQIQPAQGYAPPAMMPAQYMQQGATNPVYAQAPIYQPPAAYPHQLYQHHNYATQAGGVTYYSCAEQEQAPRAQRRPTAAIPIVRPAASDRSTNSSVKDIDRVVENMFVMKHWPATNPADSAKDKSQERSLQEPQSKESSQPNSLTSSSISTDSKPAERIEQKQDEEQIENEKKEKCDSEVTKPETLTADA